MPMGNAGLKHILEDTTTTDRSRNKFLEVCFFQKARYQTLGGVLFGGLVRNDNKQFLAATMHSEGFQPLPPKKLRWQLDNPHFQLEIHLQRDHVPLPC